MGAAFMLLSGLVLLRSLFHPLYLAIAASAAAIFAVRGEKLRVLHAAAIPLAVVLLWSLKNWILFGFFGTSSWTGNSLHRMMTETLPRERIEAMISSGAIHRLSGEWELSAPEVFMGALDLSADQNRGVPALDETGKTRTRENPVNYNHWVYPIASKVFRDAALRMMRGNPDAYLQSIAWTSRRFLDPTTDDVFLQPNRHPIRKSARAWERIESSPWVRILSALATLWAIPAALRRGRACPERMLIAFAAGSILWIGVLGICFEYGENNRFRYSTMALVFLLIAIMLRDSVRSLAQRWQRNPLLGE
jgi:hypothetical protein